MNSTLQAAFLGVVQGLTEFLPISSSAHLALIPWFFGWQDPGLAFDVGLHLGTLLALLGYYARDWWQIAASPFNGQHDRQRLLVLLVVASVPGAIFGLLFEHQAETIFRSPILIAATLAALGLALWMIDRAANGRRKLSEVGLRDALLIGVSQALAIVPGVSRSGITITTARALRMNRQDSANFSFLMATPIIAGAGLIKARELFHSGLSPALSAGFICSAVFGWAAIAALLRFVRTRTYVPFAWYRLGLAALTAVVYFAR